MSTALEIYLIVGAILVLPVTYEEKHIRKIYLESCEGLHPYLVLAVIFFAFFISVLTWPMIVCEGMRK